MAEQSSPSPSPSSSQSVAEGFSTASKWLNRIAGALLLLIVLAVYGYSLRLGKIPAGHPWGGLCLGSLAMAQLIDTREHSWTRITIYGCGLGAAFPWVLASVPLEAWAIMLRVIAK